MKPAHYPDLKQLIDRLDKRNRQRQAARAIMAGSALLGLLVLASPLLQKDQGTLVRTPEQPSVAVPTDIPNAFASARLTGHAAIVYDLTTKEVLYEKNAKTQLPLASLTKLITAYASLSTLAPGTPITITEEALKEDGDSGLTLGEQFTFQDLLRFALVSSSNDAAEAIADAAATAQQTSGKNLLASAISAIGLPQTYALNGTGLDVNESVSGGYGSAFDVAQLAGALIEKAPEIARSTTQTSVTIRSLEGTAHTLPNTNQDVVHIPNLLLSKTGFTDLAGGNLAIVYDAGINHPVAVVVLGSTREGRFADVEQLLTLTSAHFAQIPAPHTGSVSTSATSPITR